MKELKKICIENNSDLVCIIIPTQIQVYPERWDWVCKLKKLVKREYDILKPNKIITEFFKENNMIFVELLPYFREKINERNINLYYKDDGHWNNTGHQMASEIIYREVKELLQ